MGMYKPAKYVTICVRHGRRNADGVCELTVSKPRNRREKKVIGCPMCYKEGRSNENKS